MPRAPQIRICQSVSQSVSQSASQSVAHLLIPASARAVFVACAAVAVAGWLEGGGEGDVVVAARDALQSIQLLLGPDLQLTEELQKTNRATNQPKAINRSIGPANLIRQ